MPSINRPNGTPLGQAGSQPRHCTQVSMKRTKSSSIAAPRHCTERIASMPFLGPTASRLKVIYFSMQHTQDIYGQLVVYLRLNGITPPASNRGV